MGKSFAAVIEESYGRFTISGNDGVRCVCVLPHDAHFLTSLDQMVAKLDSMAAVYGWTVTSVTHRVRTDEGSTWTVVR
jgi:hypothetical protein